MAKKIYDVKPPKIAKKIEKMGNDIKNFLLEEEVNLSKHFHDKKRDKGSNISAWWLVGAIALMVMIVGGVYLFFSLPKAEITIWPKLDTLTFTQTITADRSVATVDSAKLVIPAKYVEISKTETQDFPATGSSSMGGKASGQITIFNKYDPPKAFTFRAGTHFLSDSNKMFTAEDKIIIPAASKSGKKITPGSISVKVQAVETGDSYNIPASKFSVPGLKGTAAYYSLYATSDSAMTGGSSGKVKKVTDDDIHIAKDTLLKKVNADAIADLAKEVPSGLALLDSDISTITLDASTDSKVGTVADTFTYKITVKASGLAFSKSDLDQFSRGYISSQIPQGKIILDSSFKDSYTPGSIDVTGGKATLNISFSSDIYQGVDKNALAIMIQGKNEGQITQIINNYMQGQTTSKVKLWPFYVHFAPKSQKSIKVELKF